MPSWLVVILGALVVSPLWLFGRVDVARSLVFVVAQGDRTKLGGDKRVIITEARATTTRDTRRISKAAEPLESNENKT